MKRAQIPWTRRRKRITFNLNDHEEEERRRKTAKKHKSNRYTRSFCVWLKMNTERTWITHDKAITVIKRFCIKWSVFTVLNIKKKRIGIEKIFFINIFLFSIPQAGKKVSNRNLTSQPKTVGLVGFRTACHVCMKLFDTRMNCASEGAVYCLQWTTNRASTWISILSTSNIFSKMTKKQWRVLTRNIWIFSSFLFHLFNQLNISCGLLEIRVSFRCITLIKFCVAFFSWIRATNMSIEMWCRRSDWSKKRFGIPGECHSKTEKRVTHLIVGWIFNRRFTSLLPNPHSKFLLQESWSMEKRWFHVPIARTFFFVSMIANLILFCFFFFFNPPQMQEPKMNHLLDKACDDVRFYELKSKTVPEETET